MLVQMRHEPTGATRGISLKSRHVRFWGCEAEEASEYWVAGFREAT
jgi:hypothetical protein